MQLGHLLHALRAPAASASVSITGEFENTFCSMHHGRAERLTGVCTQSASLAYSRCRSYYAKDGDWVHL